ncbi:MAG TPA: DUF1552 domain-containing protein [Polyangia bacterium]|jgi:hypothetical protein|nr:DUF1552 domain-containing protein [Polyangia bacterium]
MIAKHFSTRRRFLQGVGGVVVGLPALDVFQSRAQAAAPPKIYSALMLQQCGLVQGPHMGGGVVTAVVAGAPPETDMYWPRAMGPINAATMAGADADQTTSILKDYAQKLLFIRGTSFKYSHLHGGGAVAASTGAPVTGSYPRELPVSESIDVFISNKMANGQEPLTLYAGRKGEFRDDSLSFTPKGMLRVGDNNPFTSYQRVVGLTGVAQTDPGTYAKVAAQRLSVNDLVRGELKDLLTRPELSKEDRQRIDLHITSIRDMEMNMVTVLGPMIDVPGLMAINGTHTTDANIEKATQMQIDLIAFAFASDRARTATLQVGSCNDHTRYTVNGVLAPAYHPVSHRNNSDGQGGPVIQNSVQLHHGIDQIHARHFLRLLDRLNKYTLPSGGTLLDSSVNIWTNSLDNGPTHGSTNIPYLLAGGAGGALKTGQHILSPGASHRVLTTIATAAGCRKPNGDPVDNFGDPSAPGLITEILAI